MQDNELYQQVTPPSSKKSLFTIIIGITLAVILIAVGLLSYFNYHTKTESGKTVSELESELASLNTDIEELSKTESETFYKNGFSESYFESADKVGQLKIKALDLEDSIESLKEQDTKKTILNTNALWSFIASFIVIIITIVLSILLRSHHDSANQMIQ
ncbi:hypothetical protein J6V85_01915 [Candidatus Saccharibacteria bacterium]|nr:hypothetical protein [Candidatus Saccharibacteria bacterium]